jgi:hypothetical protein
MPHFALLPSNPTRGRRFLPSPSQWSPTVFSRFFPLMLGIALISTTQAAPRTVDDYLRTPEQAMAKMEECNRALSDALRAKDSARATRIAGDPECMNATEATLRHRDALEKRVNRQGNAS